MTNEQIDKYSEITVMSEYISDKTLHTEYRELNYYSSLMMQAVMEALRRDTDISDKLYYNIALPLYRHARECDIRGVKSRAYKIMNYLTPMSVINKRNNESILYQVYKMYN